MHQVPVDLSTIQEKCVDLSAIPKEFYTWLF